MQIENGHYDWSPASLDMLILAPDKYLNIIILLIQRFDDVFLVREFRE